MIAVENLNVVPTQTAPRQDLKREKDLKVVVAPVLAPQSCFE